MSERITTVLSEAQNGQAYANLARAFHLPPEKVHDAVADMLDPLMADIGERLPSRRALAELVALLGKTDYERVLESPMLLGATHTQVVGAEALAVIAGRKESNRLAHHAALAAGVSEMITEYLLPAVAAMLIGALAKACRAELEELMGHTAGDGAANPESGGYDLPRVSGGVGFTGSTGGSANVANSLVSESHYKELAEDIRRDATPDVAEAVRRVLVQALDLSSGPGSHGWLKRFSAAFSNLRR